VNHRGDFYGQRRALVVGGTSGIGLSVAELLAELGSRVTVAGRDTERLQSARSRRFETLQLDITRSPETEDQLRSWCAGNGTPELLFNCAGLAHPGYLDEQPDGPAQEMMEVNYTGTWRVCRTLVPLMRDNGGGTIVNTSSLGGLFGLFGYTGYCASKFAVVGFSEALRREVKPYRISVTVLCPPNTRTPGLLRENESKPPEVLRAEENVKTVEPDYVAQKLLKALPSRPRVVIPTLDGRLAYLLSRYFPAALDLFLKRPNR